MTDTTTTQSAAVAIRRELALPVNKSGEYSVATEKAAELLTQVTREGFVAMAVHGKGSLKKIAQANLQGVKSLGDYFAQESIDGGEWSNVLALLVSEFGANCYNRATMKGKSGADQYMALIVRDAAVKFDKAETVKAQQAAIKRIEKAEEYRAQVTRLATAHLNAPSAE